MPHHRRERAFAGVERAGAGQFRDVEQELQLAGVGRAVIVAGVGQEVFRRVAVVELVGVHGHVGGGPLVDELRGAGETVVRQRRRQRYHRLFVVRGRVQ